MKTSGAFRRNGLGLAVRAVLAMVVASVPLALGVAMQDAVVRARGEAPARSDVQVRRAVERAGRETGTTPAAQEALVRARRALAEAGRRRTRGDAAGAERQLAIARAALRTVRARTEALRAQVRARAAERAASRATDDARIARAALARAITAQAEARARVSP